MSYIKGESDLPEAPEKWRCADCEEVCRETLTAPNPFDPDDIVTGCPNCKAVNSLTGACQVGNCERPAGGGHPGGHGYRYVWTCWEHRPNKTN